jgi:hypothetical protein
VVGGSQPEAASPWDSSARLLASAGALPPAAHRRLSSNGTTRLSVNKITWEKVGHVTAPGRYMFRFGYLTITSEDLEIWKQFPNAEFALVAQPSTGPADEFILGVFDVTPATNRGD